MPATYKGLIFGTRLLAEWAAFFDLAGWEWSANPAPIGNWRPDFKASFPCRHSECGGEHTLLISVLPVEDISGVSGHPALTHRYIVKDRNESFLADAGALFGSSPATSQWEMSHGSGGGTEDIPNWVYHPMQLWSVAVSKVLLDNPAAYRG